MSHTNCRQDIFFPFKAVESPVGVSLSNGSCKGQESSLSLTVIFFPVLVQCWACEQS